MLNPMDRHSINFTAPIKRLTADSAITVNRSVSGSQDVRELIYDILTFRASTRGSLGGFVRYSLRLHQLQRLESNHFSFSVGINITLITVASAQSV
jgi:hypothetical protein